MTCSEGGGGGDGRHRRVDETADFHARFMTDAEQHTKLIAIQSAGDGQHGVFTIALCQFLQMQINEIRVISGFLNRLRQRIAVHPVEVLLIGLLRMNAGKAHGRFAEQELVIANDGHGRRLVAYLRTLVQSQLQIVELEDARHQLRTCRCLSRR